jgi:hypothetical protein
MDSSDSENVRNLEVNCLYRFEVPAAALLKNVLGCYVVLTGKKLLTFRKTILPSTSGKKVSTPFTMKIKAVWSNETSENISEKGVTYQNTLQQLHYGNLKSHIGNDLHNVNPFSFPHNISLRVTNVCSWSPLDTWPT